MYRDLQASSNKRHNIKHNTQMIQLSSVVVITMGEIQHCTINPNLHCTMYNSSKNCQHLHSAALCQSAVNPNALLLVLWLNQPLLLQATLQTKPCSLWEIPFKLSMYVFSPWKILQHRPHHLQPLWPLMPPSRSLPLCLTNPSHKVRLKLLSVL